MCLVLLLYSGCCSASRRAVPMHNKRFNSVTVPTSTLQVLVRDGGSVFPPSGVPTYR